MTAIHHIAFHCHDIKAQEKFYARHFAFKRVWTFNEGKADEFIMLRCGACCLEFFPRSADTATTERGGEQKIGLRHLAFSVDNLEAAIAKLKEDGITPDPILDKLPVPGLRICLFRDPEGNILELMENWPANA